MEEALDLSFDRLRMMMMMMSACMDVCMYLFIGVCVCMYVFRRVCIYLYMCVYMYICIFYIYVSVYMCRGSRNTCVCKGLLRYVMTTFSPNPFVFSRLYF